MLQRGARGGQQGLCRNKLAVLAGPPFVLLLNYGSGLDIP